MHWFPFRIYSKRRFPVSHVRVLRFSNPSNDNTGIRNVIYTVNHIRIFKLKKERLDLNAIRCLQKPSRVPTLPPFVLTPSNGATCGLYLQVGKEYLLS
ncbi:hypothetical protein COOONC_23651, partial [Cooperia oncophora]